MRQRLDKNRRTARTGSLKAVFTTIDNPYNHIIINICKPGAAYSWAEVLSGLAPRLPVELLGRALDAAASTFCRPGGFVGASPSAVEDA